MITFNLSAASSKPVLRLFLCLSLLALPTLSLAQEASDSAGQDLDPEPTVTSTPILDETITPNPTAQPTASISASPMVTQSPTSSPIPTDRPYTNCQTDINQDGVTDVSDFAIFSNDFLKTTPQNSRSDINQDGLVDLEDYSLIVINILQACN